MGYQPIVNCRACGEPLDVYVPHEDRFCSEDCANGVAAKTPWCIPAGEGNECVVCFGDDPERPGKIIFVVKPPIGTSDVLAWDALNATTALLVKAVNSHAALVERGTKLVEHIKKIPFRDSAQMRLDERNPIFEAFENAIAKAE